MPEYALITAQGKIKTIISADKEYIDSLYYGDCFVLLPNKKQDTYSPEVGDIYDHKIGEFTQPKPYESWIKSGSTWIPPKAYPTENPDNLLFVWDEPSMSWVEAR
jgi:hypothetical protein